MSSDKYDLCKLIRLCEELNSSYLHKSYFAVAMLTRAIIDHIPLIFNCNNFPEVANNYQCDKSFKKSMQNLQNSLRNISDGILHSHIRNKESLPNETQVNFYSDLDLLLSEIARILS